MLQIRSCIVGLCTVALLSCGLADVAFAQEAGRGRGNPVARDKVVYDQAQLNKEWAEVQKRYPQFARSHVELQVAVLSAATVYSRLASAATSGEAGEPILIDTRVMERVLSNGALGFGSPARSARTFVDRLSMLANLFDPVQVTCMQRALRECTIMGDDGNPDILRSCLKAKTDACLEDDNGPCVGGIAVPVECVRYICVPDAMAQSLPGP